MSSVETNGIRLHYSIDGSGAPVLLIAGFGQHAGAWAAALPHLTNSYQVISFDNRGVGRSDVPAGPYTIDQMADDTAGMIEALGLGPIDIVGWSMGGSILQSLMIRHGALVKRAVLLNGFASYTDVQQDWLDAMLALKTSGVAPRAAAIFAMAWGFTSRITSDHALFHAVVDRAVKLDPTPSTYEGVAAQADGLRAYDSRAQLERIDTPTLVIGGAEDILTPIAQSWELAKLIPGAEMRAMPRGGHSMVQEYPVEVTAAIRAFLG